MITCIREVRRAKGLTLHAVAARCDPPTTPQTIGRLETGTRTVSVGWLNRIAKALGVDAQATSSRVMPRARRTSRIRVIIACSPEIITKAVFLLSYSFAAVASQGQLYT